MSNEREQRALGLVMQRTGDPMYGPVIARGRGSRVWDTEGRCYFDLICGYSAANFGHAFEPLVAAATEQLQTLTHLTGLAHPGRTRLAEQLIQHCGNPDDRVIFNTSGSRAIETAIKIALTARPGAIVSIGSAYHGRSIFTSLLSDTASIPTAVATQCVRRSTREMAYCAACPLGLQYPQCDVACVDSLLRWIDENHASISAILAEPAYGARGYIVPPDAYWQRVREATARRGILMIADEIQMGLGRSGHWLLSRAQGWQADLVVLGKSLGGGIAPISAVIGRQELINCLPAGSESETFAASPLATAVGCEVMNQLHTGPWMQRAGMIGQQLRAALDKFPGKVESLGASATLELIGLHQDTQRAAETARAWAVRFRQAGLLVHYTGPMATRIVLLPALTIDQAELDEVLRILGGE